MIIKKTVNGKETTIHQKKFHNGIELASARGSRLIAPETATIYDLALHAKGGVGHAPHPNYPNDPTKTMIYGTGAGNLISLQGTNHWYFLHLDDSNVDWEIAEDLCNRDYFAIKIDNEWHYYTYSDAGATSLLLARNGCTNCKDDDNPKCSKVNAGKEINEMELFAETGDTGSSGAYHLHLVRGPWYEELHPLKDINYSLYIANNHTFYISPTDLGPPKISLTNTLDKAPKGYFKFTIDNDYNDVYDLESFDFEMKNTVDGETTTAGHIVGDWESKEVSLFTETLSKSETYTLRHLTQAAEAQVLNTLDNNVINKKVLGGMGLTGTSEYRLWLKYQDGKCKDNNDSCPTYKAIATAKDAFGGTAGPETLIFPEEDADCEPPSDNNPPGCDNPDDNYSLGSFEDYARLIQTASDGNNIFSVSQMDDAEGSSPIAILDRGASAMGQGLLSGIGVGHRMINPDEGMDLSGIRLMVLPSGSLHGLSNSMFLMQALDDYVRRGGMLLTFAQQYGEDYGALPLPPGAALNAYGWRQDQSCFRHSAYLEAWHPMLAGLSGTMYPATDGFFTGVPAGAEVLLRRNSSGFPCLFTYPLGMGRVIVTTLFADATPWNTPDEQGLIRGILQWASADGAPMEVRRGETVQTALLLENRTEEGAAKALIYLEHPRTGKTLAPQEVVIEIAPGEAVPFDFSYAVPVDAPPGIYRVNYLLMNADDEPMGEALAGGAFSFLVREEIPLGYQGGNILVSIVSDREEVVVGESVHLTTYITNKSDSTIDLRLDTPEVRYVTVPAQQTVELEDDRRVDFSRRFITHVYSADGLVYYGKYVRRIWAFRPDMISLDVQAALTRDEVLIRDTLAGSVELVNDHALSWAGTMELYVDDAMVRTQSVAFGTFSAQTIPIQHTLDGSLPPGSHTLECRIRYNDRLVATAAAPFTIISSLYEVAFAPDSMLIENSTGELAFSLANVGLMDTQNGRFAVTLFSPDGDPLYSQEQPFSAVRGQVPRLLFPVTIPSLKFGVYALQWRLADETGTLMTGDQRLENAVVQGLAWDRAFYRIRENGLATVTLRAPACFSQTAVIAVSIPDIGYSEERTVHLEPAAVEAQAFAFTLPEGLAAGQHMVRVQLSDGTGIPASEDHTFVVPTAALDFALPTPAAQAGQEIVLRAQNQGGVDADMVLDAGLYDTRGLRWAHLYQQGTISAGGFTDYQFQVPSEVFSGTYSLIGSGSIAGAGQPRGFGYALDVSGYSATLAVQPAQAVYPPDAPIAIQTAIHADGPSPADAILSTEIVRRSADLMDPWAWYRDGVEQAPNPDGSLSQNHLLRLGVGRTAIRDLAPLDGYVSRYDIGQADTDTFGNVYIVDSNNSTIHKFDALGQPVAVWGGYGMEDGYFDVIVDIAVDSENEFVYVSDEAGRIQKFNLEGLWMGSVGTPGVGPGFNNMPALAVDESGNLIVGNGWSFDIYDRFGELLASHYDDFIGQLGGRRQSTIKAVNGKLITINWNTLVIYDYEGNKLRQWSVSTPNSW